MRRMLVAVTAGVTMAAAAASGSAGEQKPSGGAYNLRLVSDAVPDFSSRENFVRSALSGWKTDQEKSIAQFRWVHRSRRVGSPMVEDGRPVLDPVLFFNSYGVTFCSTISLMNVSLWEAAGYPGRCASLNAHCVAEVNFNNRWHMFDSDFCNYFLDETGEVASAEMLFKGRKREEGKWYLYDHCPTASFAQGRILMGPSSASLADVASDWYKRYAPREGAQGAHAGQRYILGLQPGQTYTRYWKPLGTGVAFGRPYKDGKEPGENLTLKNGRANGEWRWVLPLGSPEGPFASENIARVNSTLRPKDETKPAFAVFRIAAANVVTSARVGVHGSATVQVSADGGRTWQPVALVADEKGVRNGVLDIKTVGGRLEFLLKIELAPGQVLGDLEVITTTGVNQRTLPALHLGTNRIVALSDEHLETVTLAPRLASPDYTKECVRVSGFTPVKGPRDWQPSLRGDSEAELVLQAATPRDIKYLRLAATAYLAQPQTKLTLSASFDGGKSWKDVGQFGRREPYADQRIGAETRDVPAGTRAVLLRWSFAGAAGAVAAEEKDDDKPSVPPMTGLTNVFAEVGYEAAGAMMPYTVTYCWEEWRDGAWKERQHNERVAEARHAYAINVGGTRPPRMKWVRQTASRCEAKPYSDGEDVGAKFARPEYALTYGNRISVGAKYTVSRAACEAFPDTSGRILTDGYVSLASYWGLGLINLTGEKNVKRVGELAVWPAGEPLVVTVDLGKAQTVGGARICAVQPNLKVLFPETMTVETSADGKAFAPAGKAHWEDCFFPPGDEMLWEGADSPLYDDLPAGGILDHKFAVCFEKPVEARYVRFTLAAPTDKNAGIGLWELEVYDRLATRPWSDRLQLP